MVGDVGRWLAKARVTGAGGPVAQGGVRPNPIVVVAPGADHDPSLPETVEDLQLQALVPEFCSERPPSWQARARLMPWASCPSIWRSFAMIGSGLAFRPLGILGSSGSS